MHLIRLESRESDGGDARMFGGEAHSYPRENVPYGRHVGRVLEQEKRWGTSVLGPGPVGDMR